LRGTAPAAERLGDGSRFGEPWAWWAYAVVLGMVYLTGTGAAGQAGVRPGNHGERSGDRPEPDPGRGHCGLGDSLAYEERYEESVRCFNKVKRAEPQRSAEVGFFTYGGAGFPGLQGRNALRGLQAAVGEPRFSIEYARQELFYLKRRGQIDLYMNGLRLAGVPDATASGP
jgi:hypothetical protein